MAPGHRLPYNKHVQRDRQEKFYERKKTLNKYKRFQKYEAQQKPVLGKTAKSFLEKITSEDADAINADYERRLAMCYGGGGTDMVAGTSNLDEVRSRPKKKKKKTRATDPTPIASMAASASAPHSPKVVAGKVSGGGASCSDAKVAKEVDIAAEENTEVRRSRRKKGAREAKADEGKQWNEWQQRTPARFSKELREYERTKQAALDEKERIAQEVRDRKLRKREHAKDRALKGKRLAKVNSRGQPSMKTLLESLTAKIAK
eukprot:TRINITY_DN19349_c0_g1_i1.p1 TRINITY_DN19349_c0_g1~~TRINITY_DN19349_c0_g1_i1.p1  ORF type:complete len:260 (+),score=58.42 TRINITY_DN19349_c0_g1_i1:70-849(+)